MLKISGIDGIMGPELMQVFPRTSRKVWNEIKTETIDSIEKLDNGFKRSSKGEYLLNQ